MSVRKLRRERHAENERMAAAFVGASKVGDDLEGIVAHRNSSVWNATNRWLPYITPHTFEEDGRLKLDEFGKDWEK